MGQAVRYRLCLLVGAALLPGCLTLQGTAPNAAAPGHGTAAAPNGPPNGTPPVPVVPAAYQAPPEPPAEFVSRLHEQLSELKDDRKVLLARLQMLEEQSQAKDQLLEQASQEVRAARDEVSHNQAELKRWRNEIHVLRGHLERQETEDLQTMRAIIHTLEQLLERKDTSGRRTDPSR